MQPIASILEQLPRLLPESVAWELALGASLSAGCRMEGLRDGTISVCVPSEERRRQIRSVDAEVLVRLKKLLGADRVQRVRLRVAGGAE